MRLAVEILTGTLSYVEVTDDAKVHDLKREIAAQMKLPCERLILLLDVPGDYECHLIEDAKDGDSLIDVGVYDGAHIYLFFKALGCVGNGDDYAFSDELGSPPMERIENPSDADFD